jgi:predicted MPP superfamily phosphohydrolase
MGHVEYARRNLVRVLILEDEEFWRARISESPVLNALGEGCVVQAKNFQEAERSLAEQEFDLVISDVVFVDRKERRAIMITDHALSKQLRSRNLPVFVVSGHLDLECVQDLVNTLRVVALLDKNSVEKFEATLSGVLSRLTFAERDSPSSDDFTWLHISDLHYDLDKDAGLERRRVEEAFFRDVKRHLSSGTVFDRIVVTGDVAQAGKEQQYSLAARFFETLLEITDVRPAHLHLVPGNHDVDRSEIDEPTRQLGAPRGKIALAERLRSPFQLDALAAPFAAFRRFVANATGADTATLRKDLSFVERDDVRKVAMIGVNSALGSGLVLGNGEVHDKGNLFVGERALDELFRDLDDSWLRIAMMHHPRSYLVDFDETQLTELLVRRCDVLIHGHLHVSDFKGLASMQRALAVVPCGSLFQGDDRVNSYNVSRVNLKNRRLVVRYRRYSELQKEFVKDLDTTGDERDGQFSAKLADVVRRRDA